VARHEVVADRFGAAAIEILIRTGVLFVVVVADGDRGVAVGSCFMRRATSSRMALAMFEQTAEPASKWISSVRSFGRNGAGRSPAAAPEERPVSERRRGRSAPAAERAAEAAGQRPRGAAVHT